MSKLLRLTKTFYLCSLLIVALTQIAWAATPGSAIQKVRFSQTPEKIRIVLDVDSIPEFTTQWQENPDRFVVDMTGIVNHSGLPQMTFNDPAVDTLRLDESEPGKLRLVINLKTAVMCQVFTLKSPNRVVIDISKVFERKALQQVAPGLTYTSWQRGTVNGPVWAHILDVAPGAGLVIKPVLSNGIVPGLEPVTAMAANNNALAAVNGSYFGLDGEIIGTLKLDGTIASVSDISRTAFGITADGHYFIGQVSYSGGVQLTDGKMVNINGVNRERGDDELILYNRYYGSSTCTNEFGTDYVIVGGKVKAINASNTPIPPDGVVLSAHGQADKLLTGLKVGDDVKIIQTLGPQWDQASSIIGVGPMLVKNKNVFLTTKIEDFGSDVAGGRAPRTAIGITQDRHILFVVVDGRQKNSIGLTLMELALLMQELGAVDAMNFDGGGSSEMVVNNQIMNKPSDGHERRVGDAVVIANRQ